MASEPLRFGLCYDLTKSYGFITPQVAQAARDYAALINSKGGLGGKDAIMLGPIIESQFTAVFNWPLGAALSFTMLAIMLIILAALAPILKKHLRQA